MAIGGLVNARRVAETMSRKITGMNPGQGFTANLVTASLVICASRFGLPVSTTHVSVGSLFGIGLINRSARWKMILGILLAWVTTLPMGAALAAGVYLVARNLA
jgi:PiT family inorganic phosphate transporter